MNKLVALCFQTASLLKGMNMLNLTRKYIRSITSDRKAIMEEKVLASSIFREKKKGYEESVAKPFVTKREGIKLIVFLF